MHFDFFNGIERGEIAKNMLSLVTEHGYATFDTLFPDGQHIDLEELWESSLKALKDIDPEIVRQTLENDSWRSVAKVSTQLNHFYEHYPQFFDWFFVEMSKNDKMFRWTIEGDHYIGNLFNLGIGKVSLHENGLLFGVNYCTTKINTLYNNEYYMLLDNLELTKEPDGYSFNATHRRICDDDNSKHTVRIKIQDIGCEVCEMMIEKNDNDYHMNNGLFYFCTIRADERGWMVYKSDTILHKEENTGSSEENYNKAADWIVAENLMLRTDIPDFATAVATKKREKEEWECYAEMA